ncbi:MAG TPA: galactose-1-phosphate uridylyltransferase [Nitrosopumilus sp.]|jgi:UDPglucose--hexose-1-phosphate uridylyltransferase|nr:galactose-1-phosphate uridylyltransferase [Nitrosopumilus sp.]HJL67384.1 galactose-1-phosphate uridylyltransferase [Nitrosopumilus sp.]HJM25582.1 galactose-1-phosphate uridylyltransferase [Nitrosopumilus sp.]HJO31528.1 galactose-1-phosphate uridylyltransferase [Nitrosopumilus sp.]|tara:strand:+ start:83 stop:1099 length:1017 start_codon:yes stop_codon:yes gene_type:complete
MGSIRKDYVSERFMIVSKKDDKITNPKKSPFSPGNESMTNPSVLSLVAKNGMLQRLQDDDDNYVTGWSIRVFESKNPIVSVDAENSYSDRPFYSEPAYGYHYVVVASPNAKDTFATIDTEQWSNVLVVVQDRLRWLYTQKGVTYVSIYADHGELSGNDNPHPHLNLLTFSSIPPTIEEEAEASHKILNEKGVCHMCQTVTEEIGGPRQILQTEGFIAFCPWAPSYPYEFWISPKKHTTSFSKISQKEINDLSLILRSTLGGLSKIIKNVSFNLVFHLSPEKKNSRQIHWHIEIYPITKNRSGLERGFGIFLNDVSPEQSAEKLGAACRKELAALVGIE